MIVPPCFGVPLLELLLPVLAAGELPAVAVEVDGVLLDPLPLLLEEADELDDDDAEEPELELLELPQAASSSEMALADRPIAIPRRRTCRRLSRPAMASR